MAVIAPTSIQGSGVRPITETVCTASDTFTYQQGDYLILRNPTAGALSPVIDGAGGTNWPAEGIGMVNISTGYAVGSIAVGASVMIPLDTIRAYLQGTITMTGGTGLVAALLRY